MAVPFLFYQSVPDSSSGDKQLPPDISNMSGPQSPVARKKAAASVERHEPVGCAAKPCHQKGRQSTHPARTKSGKRELASRLRAWSGFGSDDPPDRHSLPNPFVSRIPTCWAMPSTRLSSFIAEPVRFANRRTGQCSKSQPKGGFQPPTAVGVLPAGASPPPWPGRIV